MKLPFIKFFPRDWLGDDRLRLCSVSARGLWIDMLCLMHSADRRGYLQTASGTPLPLEQLARMTGCSTDEASRLLSELLAAGVCDCSEHGMIRSRRMVRETDISQIRSINGKKGADTTNRFCRGKTADKTPANDSAKDRPSEAQKLRGSEENKDPPNPPSGGERKKRPRKEVGLEDPRFVRFWALYPNKTKKPEAAKSFARIDPSSEVLDAILAGIEKHKQSRKWLGGFIDHPSTFLNQQMWTEEPQTEPLAGSKPSRTDSFEAAVNAAAGELTP